MRTSVEQILNSEVSKVKLAITDIDGVLRGKMVSKAKFESIVEKGFGFCDVVFGWDIADESYTNSKYTGWHTGYPDAKVKLVQQSARLIPWEEDIPLVLGDLWDESDRTAICPRGVLSNVISDLKEMGYTTMAAQEFEWFNFEETSSSLASKGGVDPTPITPGMFGYSMLRADEKSGYFQDLFDLMLQFDIPLEGIHTETGPGVYEAAITCSDAMEAADRAVLFKTGVKQIAQKYGIMASFMAKWKEDLPGCSGHVHQSLIDQLGNNIFWDGNTPNKMSAKFESYLAGQMLVIPEILPMIAPTVNSYKRLVEGAWAPTTLTWGVDNRTVGFRVLNESPSACRLETRICGSDTNPYLALAACLAAGAYGIKNNLKLSAEAVRGNGYEDESNGVLSRDLWEATQKMKSSEIAVELFGKDFVEHFVASREWEWKQYRKAVTDWEMKRYFELI